MYKNGIKGRRDKPKSRHRYDQGGGRGDRGRVRLEQAEKMNASKAAESDGIQPAIVKSMVEVLGKHFTQLSNAFPVISLHKAGVRDNCGSYGPTSLASIVLKTPERIFRDRTANPLGDSRRHMVEQRGFCHERYRLTNLISPWTTQELGLTGEKEQKSALWRFSWPLFLYTTGSLIRK